MIPTKRFFSTKILLNSILWIGELDDNGSATCQFKVDCWEKRVILADASSLVTWMNPLHSEDDADVSRIIHVC